MRLNDLYLGGGRNKAVSSSRSANMCITFKEEPVKGEPVGVAE